MRVSTHEQLFKALCCTVQLGYGKRNKTRTMRRKALGNNTMSVNTIYHFMSKHFVLKNYLCQEIKLRMNLFINILSACSFLHVSITNLIENQSNFSTLCLRRRPDRATFRSRQVVNKFGQHGSHENVFLATFDLTHSLVNSDFLVESAEVCYFCTS